MFCDLVGSTELASRLDPEDLRDVMADYQGRVAASAARFGGFIAKYMGDGVLIYFGWPEAGENDAERAVHAGLRIIGAVTQGGGPQPNLSVRVTIATGLVVVGEEIGQRTAQERAVIGQTPNLSARLQSIAEPGTVVIDRATRARLGDLFDCAPLGQFRLKGFAEPMLAWRVSKKSSVRSRFEALNSGAWTPLVGRNDELALLSRRWNQAKQGSGRVVLLCGEPGIGKSRLIAELSGKIRGEDHFLLRYSCSPHFQDSPLHPVIDYFEDAAGFEPDDTAAGRLQKLRRALAVGKASEQDIALIADLLSVQSDALPVLTFSPQRKRELTSAALNRQLAHLARVRPLLMLFEDAHWCDPTSRELLDLTVDAIPDMRILLVITYRPELQPVWIGKPNVSLMTLSRLDHDQAAAMASHVAALPPSLLATIAARSDGVPLFVEELTRNVVDGEAGASPSVAQSVVPATLHASLISRLDRLPAAREVAQVGAAIGREFSYALLAAVANISAPSLREALGELVAAGLVFCRGDPPEATYAFKHALVQDAAYQTMLRGRRADIHGRILRALLHSDRNIQDVQPALLGHHAAQAGLVPQAVRYFLRAGQISAKRSAMVESRANLMRGLDLAAELPNDSERRLLQAELQVALSNVQMAVLGFGAAAQGEVLAKALELCRGLEPTRHERAVLLSRTLYGEWSHKLHTGSLKLANAVAREFAELGSECRDHHIRLMSITTLATTLFLEGRLAESEAVFASASSDHLDREDRTGSAGFGVDPLTLFHTQLSRVLACLGLVEAAEAQAATGLDRARSTQHLPTLAIALSATCTTAWVLRDIRTLDERSSALVQLADEQGFSFWAARGRCYAGWVAGQRGRLDEALGALTAGISSLRSSDVTLYVPAAYLMVSDVHWLRRDPIAATEALEEASSLLARTGECWCEAEICWRQGALQGDSNPAVAESLLERAVELARRQNAKASEVRAALPLARLWIGQGKQTEARMLLAPLCAWFAGRRGPGDLSEARALVAGLEAQRGRHARPRQPMDRNQLMKRRSEP